MKIRIVEERPGELRDRADDAIRVVEQLVAHELEKAGPAPNDQITQTPAQIDYEVLKALMKRSRGEVDRIKTLMDQKIAAVLNG